MVGIQGTWQIFFSGPRDDKMLWAPASLPIRCSVSFLPKQTHSVLENYFRLPGDFGHVLSAVPPEQTKMLEKILTQHRLASS